MVDTVSLDFYGIFNTFLLKANGCFWDAVDLKSTNGSVLGKEPEPLANFNN